MPIIYILHGWSISEKNQEKWQPFINLLKKAGFKVSFLKIPGLSSPLNESWELKDYVNWLDAELKKEKKVFLMGHSFGGQLAIRYTTQNPEKISKLILIDSAGIRDQSLAVQFKRKIFLILAKTGKNFLKAPIFRKILYKMARETDYLQASPAQRKSMANVLQDEILDDLSKINCLTQIIWGENDKTTPLKNAYFMKEKIPRSKLSIIKEARHSPIFTHPEDVIKIVNEFLKKNKLYSEFGWREGEI